MVVLLLACLPSYYRNGMDGKSGILCERGREREQDGGRKEGRKGEEAFMGKMYDGRTDGKKDDGGKRRGVYTRHNGGRRRRRRLYYEGRASGATGRNEGTKDEGRKEGGKRCR